MMTVENVIQQMEGFCKGEHKNISLLNDYFNQYIQNTEEYIKKNSEILIRKTFRCMEMEGLYDKQCYYYLYSFLFRATRDIDVYKSFLKECIEDDRLKKENKFFFYNQCVRINFLESDLVDEEVMGLMDSLYSHIYESFLDEISDELSFIPKEERNQDLVVVFSTQILNVGHAPTKTLIDRCAVLERVLNKNVFIINTAEFISMYGMMNFFRTFQPNYVDAYSDMNTLPIPNYEFDFFSVS